MHTGWMPTGMKCALAIGIVLSLGLGASSGCREPPTEAPPAHVAVAPLSWSRFTALPDQSHPQFACTSVSGIEWAVSTTNDQISASLNPEVDPRHDPLPYEVDFSGALDEPPPFPPPPPPPPGTPPSTPSGAVAKSMDSKQWAIGYARDYARRHVLRVDDGWFVAFDGGENGGSLWWYPRVAGAGRKLWSRNIRGLVRSGDDVIAVGGLAHGAPATGVVLRVARRDASPWMVVGQHALLGAPSALSADGAGRIVIATTASVERFSEDGLEVLSRDTTGRYPRSLAIASGGAIVVGQSVYVHVLQPAEDGFRDEWYLLPRCQALEVRDYFCVCAEPRADPAL